MKNNKNYRSDETLKLSNKIFVIFIIVFIRILIFDLDERHDYTLQHEGHNKRGCELSGVESLCGCRTSAPIDQPFVSHRLGRNSSWHTSHVSIPRIIMCCHSSTSNKRPRWKTLSLPHRSRRLSNGLTQCWCAGVYITQSARETALLT